MNYLAMKVKKRKNKELFFPKSYKNEIMLMFN